MNKNNNTSSGPTDNIEKVEKTSSIVVFWLDAGLARHQSFGGKDILPALAHCEALRAQGAPLSHICMSTDLVESVTLAGVSDKLPQGYNWTKRRSTAVPGRPSGTVPPATEVVG